MSTAVSPSLSSEDWKKELNLPAKDLRYRTAVCLLLYIFTTIKRVKINSGLLIYRMLLRPKE